MDEVMRMHRCWRCNKRLNMAIEPGPGIDALMRSPGIGDVVIFCRVCKAPNTLTSLIDRMMKPVA